MDREILTTIMEGEKIASGKLADVLNIHLYDFNKIINDEATLSPEQNRKVKELYPKYFNKVLRATFIKAKPEERIKNLTCPNKCYKMRIQIQFLNKQIPSCPICGERMLTKEEKRK